ncbi:hypothetical protein GGTG_07394 [Gaeumannomyces tritici R3-111a-1]|uniref:Uncharacterized protein n=1 Tax=Gaeumannomyces tritici (strain R3-111a-1) TaxID=644352 RepID=J3P1J6_GAET3|nr:hypothetical protein GGTG_07394 [Gaeumannomyces tritici R3-111a-1]EJT73538.1 hypothetical protein GGTG_07394 [Gaeumannomyces tritici R3-111a-1]
MPLSQSGIAKRSTLHCQASALKYRVILLILLMLNVPFKCYVLGLLVVILSPLFNGQALLACLCLSPFLLLVHLI